MDPARPMHSPAAHRPAPAYGRYVLAALTCAYALNIADRFVVSTLIEPIKHEFALGRWSGRPVDRRRIGRVLCGLALLRGRFP